MVVWVCVCMYLAEKSGRDPVDHWLSPQASISFHWSFFPLGAKNI